MLFIKRISPKFTVIFSLLVLFVLGQYLLYRSDWLDWSQKNLLLFILIQIDLLVLLFLLYLIFRYLFSIFWELKGRKISRSLKYKLMLVYLLSITFPAFILILGGFVFLKKGLDYWFEDFHSSQIIAKLLKEEDYLRDIEGDLLVKAYRIRDEYIARVDTIRSKDLREKYRYFMQLDSIEVYDLQGELFKKTYSSQMEEKPGISPTIIEELLRERKPKTLGQPYNSNLLLRAFILVQDVRGNPYILATGKLVDPQKILNLSRDGRFYGKYLNFFLFLSLSILFFLILFLGIWVGNKLGKRLTEPLDSLIVATQKLSQRDYDLESLPPITSQDDEIARLINSFQKMAEEIRKYEETLKRYNHYLGGVLNALPVGILIVKENLEPFFQNQTFKKWFESTPLAEFEALVEKLSLKEYLKGEYFKGSDLSASFYKVFHLVDVEKELFLGVTFMRLEIFEEPLFLLIIENLQEKEILKRLSLWREVAVKIAHEIKNPLTPIKLSIERLQKRLAEEPLSEEKRFLLEKTVAVVNHYIEELRKLALDFYYFSQRPTPEKGKINLIANLEEVLELYRLAYQDVEIVLILCDEIKGEVFIKGDSSQLKRVWINLLDNSIKAIQQRGKIQIKVEEIPEGIQVIFDDSGPGFKEEVSEAFNRKDFQVLQKLGTGLVIIAGVVELNGGRISLERNPSGGARFRLVFPKI